jgi:cytochrome c-type biogenesis protein
MTALLTAAFAAGMISTVNPCGFAMLPAYLGLFLGGEETDRRTVLSVAGSVSAGFITVFAVAGAFVVVGVRSVIAWIPWMALIVGIALVAAGALLLLGRNPLPTLSLGRRGTKDRSLAGMYGFGVSYGVASLSCTLPIFLSLTAGAIAGSNPLDGLLTFLVYGLGMALSVSVITVAIGLGRDRLIARIRPLAGRINTISGIVMIAAGAFIIWYWVTVLSSGAIALAGNPIVTWIERTSATIAGVVADYPLAVAVGAAAAVALGVAALRSIRPAAADDPAGSEVGSRR